MIRTVTVASSIFALLFATGCTRAGDDEKIKKLTERIDKLEKSQAGFGEVEEFLRPHMAQAKAQDEQKAASEPDPEAVFAVNIAGNAFDGPAGAPVTIIEAFDFD